ncbi:zinc finger associated protein [Popillia japonica]|uniref:Zinc finger associated protein n=1 Tax=Popillia japonica TaxID=7064 RepID=A0AAW1LSR1_POPJA
MLRTPPRSIATFVDAPLPESPANKNKDDLPNLTHTISERDNDSTLTPSVSHSPSGMEDLTDEQILQQIKNLQRLLEKRRGNIPVKRNLYKDLGSDEERSSKSSPVDMDGSDEERSSKSSPVDMDASFSSTTSLAGAVRNSQCRKRKGSASPSSSTPPRRFKVTAQINAKSSNTSHSTAWDHSYATQLTSRPKPSPVQQGDFDRIEVMTSQTSGQENLRPQSRRFPELPVPVQQGDFDRIEVMTSQTSGQENLRPQSRRFPELPVRTQRTVVGFQSTSSNADKTQPNSPSVVTAEKIPPIVLREKSLWAKLSTEIKRRGINFSKAQNIPDGIRIFPSTEADYRAITKFFTNDKIPYHTYQLPSEKLLNVVLRSVPVEISERDIYNDLCERGFTPDSVIRLRRTRDKAPMPLVLVKIDKKHKSIYHLKEVLSLDVTVETLKSRPTVGQCFRCQKFGHAQSRCTAPKRCVACAGDHEDDVCPRSKSEPATCANCGEEHPANYRGCSRFPKPRLQTPKPQKSPTSSGTRANEGRSYAKALSCPSRNSQSKPIASPRVQFSLGSNPTPSSLGRTYSSFDNPPSSLGRTYSSFDNPENAKVEQLMVVLEGLCAQIALR